MKYARKRTSSRQLSDTFFLCDKCKWKMHIRKKFRGRYNVAKRKALADTDARGVTDGQRIFIERMCSCYVGGTVPPRKRFDLIDISDWCMGCATNPVPSTYNLASCQG